MTIIPQALYRGESEDYSDFRHDGVPIFFTDHKGEALEYGAYLTEAIIDVDRMFEPACLAFRNRGHWMEVGKHDVDMDASERFLEMLRLHFGEERAEAIYYHVEGGSWSEVERPEIQTWLRSEGYDGFICWEGNGMTYAVFDPDKIEVVTKTYHSSGPTQAL